MNSIEIIGNTEHKIIHSDAIIALNEEIADESIDLIFADPPYNIGKNFRSEEHTSELQSQR